jgi:hypothetical protein
VKTDGVPTGSFGTGVARTSKRWPNGGFGGAGCDFVSVRRAKIIFNKRIEKQTIDAI